MIEKICKWLPPIIPLSDFGGNWNSYQKELYKIFLNDFIINKPIFENKTVEVRINPKENGYEHAFIHLTCESRDSHTDLNDRVPDLRRCERLPWNRKIIENYRCNYNCLNCKKISYYEEIYKNTVRIVLIFEDVRFKVILERRKKYILLITGYYITYNHILEKELYRAKLYFQQKTPLS